MGGRKGRKEVKKESIKKERKVERILKLIRPGG